MQRQHSASQRLASVLGGEWSDIGEQLLLGNAHPQAIDARLIATHQRGHIQRTVMRQGQTRHLIHAHAQQLRGGTIGGDNRAVHIHRQHGKLQRAEQRVKLQMLPLAGHQAHPAHLKHAGDGG